MIQLSSAGKRFGPKLLFENLNWLITPNDKVGLVGANGTGKSTLLKVLGGIESLDYGSLTSRKEHDLRVSAAGWPAPRRPHRLRRVHVGFQRPAIDGTARWRTWPTRWASSTQRLASTSRFPTATMRFPAISACTMAMRSMPRSARCSMASAFAKKTGRATQKNFLAAGRCALRLAKLLLAKPNLLLLDEPTNHLDLETRNWLEDFLLQYPFAYVLISHDRYFLDVTVDRIIEIWNKGVHFYSGNYEKYLAAEAGASRLTGRRLQKPARPH